MSTLTYEKVEGSERVKHLYAEDWFEGSDKREVYVRYYSMPFAPKDNFYVPGIDGNVVNYSGSQFKVLVANISEQTYTSYIPWLIRSEAGKNQIHVEKIDRVLPSTDYILISTPMRGANPQAYDNASKLMDGFVGMLRLVGGNNLLRQLVREAAVDVNTRNMKTPTDYVPVPHAVEGPFAEIETWLQLDEVLEALTRIGDPDRSRITLATQLIEQAFVSQGSFKFFSYWIAIEVAADTHSSQRIVSLLAQAYDKTNAYVQNVLGFQHLWSTRTDVFHGGESYEIPSFVERYLQLLFLDVVRATLRLKSRRYMASAIEVGFDVSRLDRKTGQAVYLTIEGP